jgi:hypothetical protein
MVQRGILGGVRGGLGDLRASFRAPRGDFWGLWVAFRATWGPQVAPRGTKLGPTGTQEAAKRAPWPLLGAVLERFGSLCRLIFGATKPGCSQGGFLLFYGGRAASRMSFSHTPASVWRVSALWAPWGRFSTKRYLFGLLFGACWEFVGALLCKMEPPEAKLAPKWGQEELAGGPGGTKYPKKVPSGPTRL